MIRLTRVRTAEAIPHGFRGARRLEHLTDLIAQSRTGSFDFKSTVWKTAKEQLKAETFGKCAYCEAATSVVAHGDVEHFRPKSVYWWLAYCYDNYTYACQICNQTFKGDRFPVAATPMNPGDVNVPALLTPDPLDQAQGMSLATFHAQCTSEGPHLPDVYFDYPEDYFRWEADQVRKEVRIAARTSAPLHERAAEAAVSVLGLNRAELIGLRWQVFDDLQLFRELLDGGNLSAHHATSVRTKISAMMADDGEFAGMVRYFVRDQWNLAL